ncbi:MAG: hypothetical protein AVDCRST_MAG68-3112, partial [uncultured Gemmatimonadetes bacterium]
GRRVFLSSPPSQGRPRRAHPVPPGGPHPPTPSPDNRRGCASRYQERGRFPRGGATGGRIFRVCATEGGVLV